MIKLIGGDLYQWDTGRKVQVTASDYGTAHEIHFALDSDKTALVVNVYTEGLVYYADIPNMLLQQSNKINCYEVCENSSGEETVSHTYFKIRERKKPEDYIYTETEISRYENLNSRLNALEESLTTDDDNNSPFIVNVKRQNSVIISYDKTAEEIADAIVKGKHVFVKVTKDSGTDYYPMWMPLVSYAYTRSDPESPKSMTFRSVENSGNKITFYKLFIYTKESTGWMWSEEVINLDDYISKDDEESLISTACNIQNLSWLFDEETTDEISIDSGTNVYVSSSVLTEDECGDLKYWYTDTRGTTDLCDILGDCRYDCGDYIWLGGDGQVIVAKVDGADGGKYPKAGIYMTYPYGSKYCKLTGYNFVIGQKIKSQYLPEE